MNIKEKYHSRIINKGQSTRDRNTVKNYMSLMSSIMEGKIDNHNYDLTWQLIQQIDRDMFAGYKFYDALAMWVSYFYKSPNKDDIGFLTILAEQYLRDNSSKLDKNPKIKRAKKLKQNPAVPNDAVEIYDTILAIEARKGKNSLWPDEDFRHSFEESSRASIYGLPDGSVLIKSRNGKKLWKKFEYDEEDL